MESKKFIDMQVKIIATLKADIKILEEQLKRAVQVIEIVGKQKELYEHEAFWIKRKLEFVEKG